MSLYLPRVCLTLAVLLGILLALPLPAQVDTGIIAGSVTDTSLAVLPSAAVTIRNDSTGIETQVQTNELGRYVSPPLQPGPYTLIAELTGFRRTETSLTLTLNQRAVVNIRLEIGAMTETVTVSADALLLESETATLSSLRTEQAVKELPLNGRNFAMLVGLSTGVVPAMTQRGGQPLNRHRRRDRQLSQRNGLSRESLSGRRSRQHREP